MTKKTFNVIVFHSICWILVALPSVFFIPQHVQQSIGMYLIRLCLPLFLCAVFYLNYLWLAPKYFVERRMKAYFFVNLAVMLVLAFCMNWLMDVLRDMEMAVGGTPPPIHEHVPRLFMSAFFIARGMFPFFLSAALATSLRLALRWQAAETARRDMEMQKTEAELRNLRNQINPHFLLNTLNNIYALISFDRDKAQRAVLSLSALLRQMLYGGKNNAVALDDEIEFIHNYVELMRIRLSKNVRIDFCTEVKPGTNISLAPFIFISLVENAFKHGVSPNRQSFISIRISADEMKIQCEIRNSNYPKKDTDKSGHGIGLEQVAKRLDLAYPGKYEWNRGVDEQNNTYFSRITIYDTDLRNNRR